MAERKPLYTEVRWDLFRTLGGVRFAVKWKFYFPFHPVSGRFNFLNQEFLSIMMKYLFLLLSAVFAADLAAGTGISGENAASVSSGPALRSPGSREENLALFMAALLEKNTEKQCLKLLEVIEKDPANAETPFAAFYASFRKLKKTSAVVEKLNAVWKKYPQDRLITLYAAVINRYSGTPAAVRMKQLEPILSIPPQKLCADRKWQMEDTASLLSSASEIFIQTARFQKLVSLAESWSRTPDQHRLAAFLTLGGPCYTAALKAYCSGDRKTGAALEKWFFTAVDGIKALEGTLSNNKSYWSVLYFYSQYRKLLKDEPLRFAQYVYDRTRSNSANIWLLSTAVDNGSVELFDQAAARIFEYNPRFNAGELRIKTLLNGKNFEQAEKEIRRLPENKQFDFTLQLLVNKNEWRRLYALIDGRLNQGTPPDVQIGYLLLLASEKLSDPAVYRRAKKILEPHLKTPSVANSVGYIGAVLETDLEDCRKYLRDALRKEPKNYAYLDSMAWISFKQKRYAEAEKWISKALASVNTFDGVAVLLEHAGDIAAARGQDPRVWYQLSLKYAPFDDDFSKEAVLKKMKALQ